MQLSEDDPADPKLDMLFISSSRQAEEPSFPATSGSTSSFWSSRAKTCGFISEGIGGPNLQFILDDLSSCLTNGCCTGNQLTFGSRGERDKVLYVLCLADRQFREIWVLSVSCM
nr:uncharacterized protein LOC104091379 [Nicotiana tomentosiformis]